MNVDRILETLNRFQVAYILIGGMNFLLRHKTVLTYDIDVWIEDSPANRSRCEQALADLDAQWGKTEAEWKPVAEQTPGWLASQAVFSLTSAHGAIDIFRHLAGVDDWNAALGTGYRGRTSGGVDFVGLSDADMLRCQYALEAGLQKRDRIETLQQAIREAAKHDRPGT